MHLHIECVYYASENAHLHTHAHKLFGVWGRHLDGSCWVSGVYVGSAAESGETCRLGSREGRAATQRHAGTILAVVINITSCSMVVILISVIFGLAVGDQGAVSELCQRSAKNPKADLISEKRENMS